MNFNDACRILHLTGEVLYLRVEKEFEEKHTSADWNLKISDLLTKYEKYL